jgi:predicted N-acyltransferase
MQLQFIDSIDQCSAHDWNRVAGTDYPFLRHEFLAALERSGSVAAASGWEPQHLLFLEHDRLVAVLPLYRKHHSYGEYVFDWSWADAYRRAGWQYYPKLLSAIPFTPATGPRLACLPGDEAKVLALIQDQLWGQLNQAGASGLHILFPGAAQAERLRQHGMLLRQGVQYHWLNTGYRTFGDFVGEFSSRKRKNLNKERRRVQQQGVDCRIYSGGDLHESLWDQFYRFYQITYARYSGHGGYLDRDFFSEIGQSMPENVVLVMAYQGATPVAGALNFRSSSCLYGRNWGTISDIDCLHFEACYYQGIEYCIDQGLEKFDPGAQGEHKIARGFHPLPVYSCHWLAEPGAQQAIGDFVRREQQQIDAYIRQARESLPFKQSDTQ